MRIHVHTHTYTQTNTNTNIYERIVSWLLDEFSTNFPRPVTNFKRGPIETRMQGPSATNFKRQRIFQETQNFKKNPKRSDH